MTMIGGRPGSGTGEVGQTIAEFPTYEAAQKAVSSLITGEVPARDIAIVGTGLRSIEKVTGRLGYASAARSGAINGVLLGLLFSAILVIGTPTVPIQAFVGVLFVGIAIGMLMSIITYTLVRRRRDFASVVQVVADHYEVTVAAASMHKARQVLGAAAPSAPAAPRPQRVASAEPPKYGERVVEPDVAAADADVPADAGARDAATLAPHVPNAPGVSASGEPAPGASAVGEPVSGEPVSGEPVSGEPAPGEPVSGESAGEPDSASDGGADDAPSRPASPDPER